MKHKRPKLSSQILDEASEWFVDFSQGDIDTTGREKFDAWLRRSPEHVRAYLQITAFWEDASFLEKGRTLASQELVARALKETNVVPLGAPEGPQSRPVSSNAESGAQVSELDRGSREETDSSRITGSRSEQSNTSEAKTPLLGQDREGPIQGSLTKRVRLFALAASVLLMIAAASAWIYTQRDTYTTGIGEQRSIALADGSTVDLNSRSKLRIRYTDNERDVELLKGQAVFRVAKDHTRPFVVEANGTRVRAVGTQFDVYRKTSDTIVTVLEGRVAVASENASPSHSAGPSLSSNAERDSGSSTRSQGTTANVPGIGETSGATTPLHERGGGGAPPSGKGEVLSEGPTTWEGEVSQGKGSVLPPNSSRALQPHPGEILLAAGEQLTVTPNAVAAPKPADVTAATAWTRRQIVFRGTALSDVIEEFNRYNTRQLSIEDPSLKTTRISGVFSSTDPDSLLHFLAELPNIRVEESRNEIRILARARESL
jgi:ferric-dicitrate binding protein FerR (iron transport regulator)